MTMPTVTVEIELASPGIGPGSLILDSATDGLLDTDVLTSVLPTFVDVTDYVLSASTKRGSSRVQGPIVRYEAGTATALLRNDDRRFDPTNSGSPYFVEGETLVTPMRLMRLRATWDAVVYDLWRGFVDSWALGYRKSGNYSDVVVAATDGFKVLTNHIRAAVAPVGDGESSGARVNRILDSAEWPSVDRVVDETKGAPLQATTLEGDALAELMLVVDSEAGEGYMDGEGRFVFRDRDAITRDERSAYSQAIFSESFPVIALTLDGSSGAYASSPDASDFDITGDLDVRVACAADDWTSGASQTLIAKDDASANRSYRLRVSATGVPELITSANGTTLLTHTATTALTTADDEPLLIRATIDVDDGAGNRVVVFYTKPFNPLNVGVELESDANWTQLGTTVTTAGTTSIFAGTAPLEIGAEGVGTAQRFDGTIYGAVLKSGIRGSVVAKPDFTAQTAGATSFTDGAGHIWTKNGAAGIAQVGTEGLPYDDVAVEYDDAQLINDVRVSIAGGTVQTASDTASQDKYLIHSYERTDLVLDDDSQALLYAQWIRDHNAYPELRFSELTIKPLRDPTNLFPQVLGREIGDRISIVLRPAGGGTITRDVLIRGISHEVTKTTWATKWALQDASGYDRAGAFQLDFDVLGVGSDPLGPEV